MAPHRISRSVSYARGRLLPTRALLLTAALLVATACGPGDAEPESTGEMPADGAAAGEGLTIEGGFATPESVLHDEADDVYLVSNISGDPLAEDGDGFISRVSPDGEITELRWIDGTAEGVELNAPKGMAVRGDTLYVADIDCVRMFVRTSGEPAGEVCFDEATFLNDVAVDRNGSLYVTDSGLTTGFEPSGTDAVYRFDPDGRRSKLAQGDALGRPNGIAFGSRGGFVVSFGSGEVYQLAPDGSTRTVVPARPDRQLDGIAFTPDGGFLFSSWGDQAVYRVDGQGAMSRVVEGVEAPADIAYDATRHRVLIPLFNADQVLVRDLPETAGAGAGGAGGDTSGGGGA